MPPSRGKPFEKNDPRINRKGRPPTGQSMADIARAFMKGDVSVKVKDKDGKTEKEEKINRTLLFLEAIYNRATRGSDAAARLLWNYVDGLPPFTGRLGALPPEGEEVDPADEEAIKQHLRDLVMGKGINGNGDDKKKPARGA